MHDAAQNKAQYAKSPGNLRVLVVAQHAQQRRAIAAALIDAFEVVTSEELFAGLALVAGQPPDVVVLDAVRVQDDDLAEVFACCDGAEVVLLLDEDLSDSARSQNVFHVMRRANESLGHLERVVRRAAQQRIMARRISALEARVRQQEGVREIISASRSMDKVFELAHAAAALRSAVLIVGESGTGKELLARGIHRQSGRASGPFVVIECGALQDSVLERELWGSQWASEWMVDDEQAMQSDGDGGAIELARGGTIFLADINKLSLTGQARLARWLEGSLHEGAARVVEGKGRARLIAASCEELKPLVDAHQMRKDLYFLLQGLLIRVPPLRRRKDDIALLAYHFMHRSGALVGRKFRRIGAEALRVLRQQRWPGNVRELEQAMARAVAESKTDVVQASDLAFLNEGQLRAAVVESIQGGQTTQYDVALFDLSYAVAKKQAIGTFERAYVTEVLARTGGNISEAARQSGLDRSNFKRLMKKVGEEDE